MKNELALVPGTVQAHCLAASGKPSSGLCHGAMSWVGLFSCCELAATVSACATGDSRQKCRIHVGVTHRRNSES